MILKGFLLPLFIAVVSTAGLQSKVKADYWLVIGSYRQGPGSKPHVSGITSPTLFAIPIGTKKMCEEAGKQIEKDRCIAQYRIPSVLVSTVVKKCRKILRWKI